jgi:hypothetical protein
MRALCARLLGIGVDKFEQDADWSGDLEPELLRYAALLDAALSLRLCARLLPLALGVHQQGLVEAPTTDLVTGENVEFLYRGRVCAVGKVEFDGNNGRQRKWGTLTIGRGRSLLRIK